MLTNNAFWIEFFPINPATGNPVRIRVCSLNTKKACGIDVGNGEWLPYLASQPDIDISVFEGTFTGASTVNIRNVEATDTNGFSLNFYSYVWDGTDVVVYRGDSNSDDLGDLTVVFTGVVSASPTIDESSVTWEIEDRSSLLVREIFNLPYAGTGGLEGTPEMQGTFKPISLGSVLNAEPVLIDPVNLVYQYHGHGPAQGVVGLYENGLQFPAAKTVVPFSSSEAVTYANLIGTSLAPGEWADCPALGCFRLGGEPVANGVITVDVIGDTSCSSSRVDDFLQFIMSVPGVLSNLYDGASFSSVYSGSGNQIVGVYLTSPVILRDLMVEVLSHMGAYYFFSSLGKLRIGFIRMSTPALHLRSDGTSEPVAEVCNVLPVSAPYKKIRMGADRVFRVHGPNEISDALRQTVIQAQTQIDAATVALLQASSDEILTGQEKNQIVIPNDAVYQEWYTQLSARATALGISQTALNNARNAYLASRNALNPAWNDRTQSSSLAGSSFRTNFINYGAELVRVEKAISEEDAKRANWPNVVGTGRPEDNADVTAGRIAAGIAGQGAWATLNVSTSRVSRIQDDGYIQGGNIYLPNVSWLNEVWPEEYGANRTETRIASGIVNQGVLATRNNINLGTDATGFLPVNLADTGLRNNAITVNNNTGELQGIGSWGFQVWNDLLGPDINNAATTATWGNVSSRPAFAVDTIFVDGQERLNPWYVRNPGDGSYLAQRWAAEGGANVTENRVAASIANQSAWATYNSIAPNAVVNPTFNLISDPGLRLNGKEWNLPSGWSVGQGSDVGNYAFNNSNAANMRVGKPVSVWPNSTYTFSVKNGGTGYSGVPVLQLNWYDSAGTYISQVLANGRPQDVGYLLSQVTGTAPGNAAFAECFVQSPGGFAGSGNRFYVVFEPKLELGTLRTLWRDDNTSGALYNTGADIDTLRPAEFGANITENRISAGIVNQAAWATATSLPVGKVTQSRGNWFPYPFAPADGRSMSDIGWQNTSGPGGALFPFRSPRLDGVGYVYARFSGGGSATVFPFFDVPWEPGVPFSVGLSGYGGGGATFSPYVEFLNSTRTSVLSSHTLTANGTTDRWEVNGVTPPAGTTWVRLVCRGFFDPSGSYQDIVWWAIKMERGPFATPFDGASEVRVAGNVIEYNNGLNLNQLRPGEFGANVTEGRVAAAIAGQGDLATRNSATLPFGYGNLVINSDFVNSTFGWAPAWDGTTGGTINRGINLPGWHGQINVLFANRVGTPPAGAVFDAFITDAPGGTAGYRRFAIPVLPGERIYHSWLLGPHRCNAHGIIGFYNGSGDYISEWAGSTVANNGGASGGNPATMGRSEGFATAPENARYARIWVRAVVNGENEPYIFCAQPFVTKVPSSQTSSPPYSPGPSDRAADRTADQPIVSQLNPANGRTNSRRALSQIMASGVLSMLDTNPISAITDGSNISTITINAHQVFDDAGTIAFSSASIGGLVGSTMYYVYEYNPDFVGGARSYVATTSRLEVTGAGRRYVGIVTTPAPDAPPSWGFSDGGGGPPGGEIP